MSGSKTRRIASFGFRPWEAMPTYSRAFACDAAMVRAKNESPRVGPGGGKMCVAGRPKSP